MDSRFAILMYEKYTNNKRNLTELEVWAKIGNEAYDLVIDI